VDLDFAAEPGTCTEQETPLIDRHDVQERVSRAESTIGYRHVAPCINRQFWRASGAAGNTLAD
jgi:hypothetical protein